MAVQVSATASGDGQLTVKVLMETLRELPDDATIDIKTGDSQMDGAYWNLTAKWTGYLKIPGTPAYDGR